MKHDLIFHLVPKRKWKDWQTAGEYRPVTSQKEINALGSDWIQCLTGEQVETFANSRYSERKNILMLVINTQRLSEKLEYKDVDGQTFPMVEHRINLDAIIDKILLMPNQDGAFEIQVEEA